MNKAKTLNYAGNKEFRLLHREISIPDNMVSKISTRVQIHDKVEIF